MADDLAAVEADSIRAFVHKAADAGYLRGRVLDVGCGTSPYRRIVEEHGGTYEGHDLVKYGGNVSGRDVGDRDILFYGRRPGEEYDAVLCTQVLQYVPQPMWTLGKMADRLNDDGHLVMTYPTTWPEIRDDLWRFTKLGMEKLLADCGYEVVLHEQRADVILGFHRDSSRVALGYGVVAKRVSWPTPANLPADYWETAT